MVSKACVSPRSMKSSVMVFAGLKLGEISKSGGGHRRREPAEECSERLCRLAALLIQSQQPIDRGRQPAHGHLGHDPAELRTLLGAATTDEHEVLRQRLVSDLANAALESNRGNVMLAAPIRAAADLDVAVVHERHEFRMSVQVFSELAAEAPRLRDGQAATLGPRAAHDVGDGVRARGPEAGRLEPLIQPLRAIPPSPTGTARSDR